jgi:SPX domain protein involved in polyphosphate accumulation
VNTSAIQLPADETVRIRVKFDTFYVRKDAALHNDFRELVVRSPDVRLLPLEQ